MPVPPSDDPASSARFSDVNEELAAAREALLRFAEAEGALESLVCAPSEPDCRYPDLAAVRQHAPVDELLRVVARIPDADEERQSDEGTALYASLLQLAEVFDILIDQHSLVYGDAVALAEALERPVTEALRGR